jgi:hypothetical protein
MNAIIHDEFNNQITNNEMITNRGDATREELMEALPLPIKNTYKKIEMFLNRLNTHNVDALLSMIQNNTITGIDIKAEDIIKYRKYFTKTFAEIQGKAFTITERKVKREFVDRYTMSGHMRPEIQRRQIEADFMFVNGVAYLVAIDNTNYITIIYVHSRNVETTTGKDRKELLIKIKDLYNRRGLTVIDIQMDGDSSSLKIQNGSTIDTYPPQKKCSKAERTIRMIKNAMRTMTFSGVRIYDHIYTKQPTTFMMEIYKYYPQHLVRAFNYKHYAKNQGSPYMLYNGYKPRVDRELNFSFGQIIAINKSENNVEKGSWSNGTSSRADLAIFVGNVDNQMGSHYCLKLDTKKW